MTKLLTQVYPSTEAVDEKNHLYTIYNEHPKGTEILQTILDVEFQGITLRRLTDLPMGYEFNDLKHPDAKEDTFIGGDVPVLYVLQVENEIVLTWQFRKEAYIRSNHLANHIPFNAREVITYYNWGYIQGTQSPMGNVKGMFSTITKLGYVMWQELTTEKR